MNEIKKKKRKGEREQGGRKGEREEKKEGRREKVSLPSGTSLSKNLEQSVLG